MDLLCYYATTTAVGRTRRSLLAFGGLNRDGEKGHGTGRFPNHIALALALNCADELRGKCPDHRALLRSKSRNGLDRPAPATSIRSPCCYLDILCKVVVGDGNGRKSSRKTSLNLSRARGGKVVVKPSGRSPGMVRGTCTGCERRLRRINIGIGCSLPRGQRC